ncbi:hypothetical protein BSF42_33740 [Flavobacterium sp. ACN6]|nr:hypothetical protein BSF42_33740 [Flavobacterium sp. ACN6]
MSKNLKIAYIDLKIISNQEFQIKKNTQTP